MSKRKGDYITVEDLLNEVGKDSVRFMMLKRSNDYEIEILKKMSEWPKCVETSLNKLEPHRIPFYLYQLVTLFHSYWNLGKENKEYRFILEKGNYSNSRLALLQSLSIVIKNGMSILGVSTPRIM